ncbi:MBL fold metallo-hydrolase [Demequina sp. NBRC 110052]|uniref:MBL fold metallo-hydrolase n=1 Tax=Demequina sp. NBRC 110052 TaxID=1570341 RepID=UPI000A022DD1|nr:MBL fold metallo-hydrolase [Demequina sp. NBRC 110052]
MRLTKHRHACVELERDGRTVLIDPGSFDPRTPELLARADAVLFTHAHADHLDSDALSAELARRPSLPVRGLESVIERFTEIGAQVKPVEPGDEFRLAGLEVSVHGGVHAEVYPHVPRDPNVGYLLGGRVLHPGDSYEVPHVAVHTLLVPISGPWTRFAETAAYVNAVSPRRAIAIHDAAFSDIGLSMAAKHWGAPGHVAVPIEQLGEGEAVEI